MANEAGADGPAIMSIGPLGELSNVAFLENIYHCPAGQYSDIVEDDIQNQGGDQVSNARATPPVSSKR